MRGGVSRRGSFSPARGSESVPTGWCGRRGAGRRKRLIHRVPRSCPSSRVPAQFSGFFKSLRDELADVIQLPDPDGTPARARRGESCRAARPRRRRGHGASVCCRSGTAGERGQGLVGRHGRRRTARWGSREPGSDGPTLTAPSRLPRLLVRVPSHCNSLGGARFVGWIFFLVWWCVACWGCPARMRVPALALCRGGSWSARGSVIPVLCLEEMMGDVCFQAPSSLDRLLLFRACEARGPPLPGSWFGRTPAAAAGRCPGQCLGPSGHDRKDP